MVVISEVDQAFVSDVESEVTMKDENRLRRGFVGPHSYGSS